MLSIFNQIANLASGTLSVLTAVAAAAPQASAETQKQATLDLAGVALEAAAKVASAGTGNIWVALGAEMLPAIYDEVMTIVNKNGLISASLGQATSKPTAPAPVAAVPKAA
jgi:hypothetical protein